MMSDFRKLLGRGFESTGSFIHKADDGTFFSAIDFKKLSQLEIPQWENVFRDYLNFYSEQLFKTMKGKMELSEVGKVVQTAWNMRHRSVFVFKTLAHPWQEENSFLAGVGHVRADGHEEKLPSEADGIEMPRTNAYGLEIGRLCLCPNIRVDEKKSVIQSLLQLYVPVISRDMHYHSLSLRTSKRHRRYYQDVFSEFLYRTKEFFLSGDRDVILQIDPKTLVGYRPIQETAPREAFVASSYELGA
jgi:hypothetical protein